MDRHPEDIADADNVSASTASAAHVRAPKRNFASRLFEYDIFLSFALGPPPRGTRSYASDLARRLSERDFTVFFSETEAAPGEHLDTTLRTALHRSKCLVVIANRGTLKDPRWVSKEVEEFRKKHPKRPVIIINVGGALQDPLLASSAQEWLDQQERIWLDESEESVKTGIVSEQLVERLATAPEKARSNVKWRRLVGGVLAFFCMMIILLWVLYNKETKATASARASRDSTRAALRVTKVARDSTGKALTVVKIARDSTQTALKDAKEATNRANSEAEHAMQQTVKAKEAQRQAEVLSEIVIKADSPDTLRKIFNREAKFPFNKSEFGKQYTEDLLKAVLVKLKLLGFHGKIIFEGHVGEFYQISRKGAQNGELELATNEKLKHLNRGDTAGPGVTSEWALMFGHSLAATVKEIARPLGLKNVQTVSMGEERPIVEYPKSKRDADKWNRIAAQNNCVWMVLDSDTK